MEYDTMQQLVDLMFFLEAKGKNVSECMDTYKATFPDCTEFEIQNALEEFLANQD